RRRHTRFSRDWSSDVCSSDLAGDDNFGQIFGTPSPDLRAIAEIEILGQRVGTPAAGVVNGGRAPDAARAVEGEHQADAGTGGLQIGRASCRKRAWSAPLAVSG